MSTAVLFYNFIQAMTIFVIINKKCDNFDKDSSFNLLCHKQQNTAALWISYLFLSDVST